MFNNSQNNSKDNATNVNTRGLQFMNKDGFDPSTLVFGYWNSFVSIKIHPALPVDKRSDAKVFDYEKSVSTSLTLEKVTILINEIEKKILPAIKAEENKCVGVPVGGDSLIVIGTGKGITGEIRPYVAIHKSLNEKTKKPEMSIHYEFSRAYSVDDYDAASGDFKIVKDQHGELSLFVALLKAAVEGLSNAGVHSSRCVDKYYKDKVLNDIAVIAAKLGVSTESKGKGFYSKKNDVFGDSGSSYGSEPQDFGSSPKVESLNNIDDIDKFLG